MNSQLNSFLTKDIVARYTRDNTSIKDISNTLNISKNTVSSVLKKNNIEIIKRGRTKLFNKEIKKICSLYKDRVTVVEIAKTFKINKSTVFYVLRKNKIKLKDNNKIKLPYTTICRLYNKGLNATSISRKYNVSRSLILRILKRNNIKVRQSTTKYTINEHYFDVINTHTKAYYVGLLLADGHRHAVPKNRHTSNLISLSLKECDKPVLEHLKEELNYNRPIYTRIEKRPNHSNMCRLTMCGEQLSASLETVGITRDKTKTASIPNIPKQYLPSFILGVFDGDGSISGTDKATCSFSIIGTESLIQSIQDILIDSLSLSRTKLHIDKRSLSYLRTVSYTGSQAIKIMEWLYKSSPVFLKRKKDKFNLIKETLK